MKFSTTFTLAATTLFVISSTDAHLRGHRSLQTDTTFKCFKEFGCANPASIDPFCDTETKCANLCYGMWQKPCPSDDSRALVEDQEANEVKEVTDDGFKCFKEFGCDNPASIDLFCDTSYLCATSCHGMWQKPC